METRALWAETDACKKSKMETGFSLQTQTGKGMTRTKAHQDDFLGLLTKISQ